MKTVRCIKSLYKSTYKRNAFTARNTYEVVRLDADGIIWVRDNEENEFSLTLNQRDGMYRFEDYFKEVQPKEPRRPKLRAVWSKREKDLMFHHPVSWDGHLIYNLFDHTLIDGKSFRQHLIDRGYDLTTLKFSVERFTEGKCVGGHVQAWNKEKKQWSPCRECQPEEWAKENKG